MKVSQTVHLSGIQLQNKKSYQIITKWRKTPKSCCKLIKDSLFLTKPKVQIKKYSMSSTTTMKIIHDRTKMPLLTRHLVHMPPSKFSTKTAVKLEEKLRILAL